MIVEMEKMFLYGLDHEKQKILSGLQELGCVEVTNPEKLIQCEELAGMAEYETADLYEIEQRIARCQNAITALSPYAPKKGLLAHKPRVSFSAITDAAQLDWAEEVCGHIEQLTRSLADQKSDIAKEDFTKASLVPWQELDLPLSLKETACTYLDFVSLPVSAGTEEVAAKIGQQELSGLLLEQSSDKDQQYLLMISHRNDREAIWELLRAEGAGRITFGELSGTPAEEIAQCEAAISEHQRAIEGIQDELSKAAENIDALKQAYDALKVRYDCAKACQHLMHTEKAFVLVAWVPKNKKTLLAEYLGQIDCFYEFVAPEPGEDYPIQIKNNKLVEPFEVVTEMYSLPAPNSIDPNPFMAIFYFIFFGMMLSDAGYGLILVAGSLFALKKMDLSRFARKFMTLILYGGISTIIWGALYGSWFGNLIPQVASTFFGKSVNIPALFDPLNDPITILVISFALGVVHLFTGMALKAYLLIKRGHPWDAVFDVFFWYGLLIGLGMLFLPGTAGTIGKYLAIACALGLILTQGRDKKNPLLRIGNGIISLYDITGYFSDVLSYSRILALGLATGVIGNVVNTMGSLPGANIIGAVVFLLVFIVGHALNLAINALGAYVHDCRLQYVEFFGKFYESGGKPFRPLRANTKYVYVTDEEE